MEGIKRFNLRGRLKIRNGVAHVNSEDEDGAERSKVTPADELLGSGVTCVMAFYVCRPRGQRNGGTILLDEVLFQCSPLTNYSSLFVFLEYKASIGRLCRCL